jgi:O-antigen/teichoic acid export membrane protein
MDSAANMRTRGSIAPEPGARAATLSEVPAHQRHRVLAGMRWTVWLSGVAVPFSAAINLLLARVGPATLGVFGLLSVYIGLITMFLYFGGDAVVIKLIPDCRREDRPSFVASYLLVVLAIAIPWVVLGFFWPGGMRLVLGQSVGDKGNFLLLCLAPIPIFFFAVLAALRGMLEIRFSQMLAKLLTILCLFAYAIVFVVGRPLLLAHPILIIWGFYFGITALLALVGGARLVRLCRGSQLHLWLPSGFWRYAIEWQAVGIAYFLANRVDYILVFNFGGLAILGKYVVVMALATVILMIRGLVADTLLPSLTNMIATGNEAGAAQLFMMHMRILFLATVAASCGIMVMAAPATQVMGAEYSSVRGLIILMAMVQGVTVPGSVGSVLLCSVGRPRPALWTGVLHVLLFIALFLATWERWNLTGAVIAYGLATLVSNEALMYVARRAAPAFPSTAVPWFNAALVEVMVAIVTLYWMPLGPAAGAVTWLVATVMFLWLAAYDLSELKLLVQTFVPGSDAIFSTFARIG